MKLFLDTSAFIARYHSRDHHHKEAVSLTEEIGSGTSPFTRLYTSDYIIDETVTTILARTGSLELTKRYGEAIISSKAIEKLWVDRESFTESWNLFKKQREAGLSFTDSTTLLLMTKNEIVNIFTFDSHFKRLGLNTVP